MWLLTCWHGGGGGGAGTAAGMGACALYVASISWLGGAFLHQCSAKQVIIAARAKTKAFTTGDPVLEQDADSGRMRDYRLAPGAL